MPRVSIDQTDKVFEVNEDRLLYDALFDQGEELPHGCLAGSCGACRIEVISGADQLAPAGVIENNTLEAIRAEYAEKKGPDFLKDKIVRLACRAKVKGDVCISPLKRP